MKRLLLFSLSFSISLSVSAQQSATTRDGKEVILYEDGNWKYSNEKGQSLQNDNLKNESDRNSCKSLVKSKINMAARSLSFYSVPEMEGKEIRFTYQWMFDKEEDVSLQLMLEGTCVRYGDYVTLRFGNYNQVLQLQNKEKSNCNGKMTFSFAENATSLQTISKEKIKSIEIETKEGKVKENIEGVSFSKSCQCISKIAANSK